MTEHDATEVAYKNGYEKAATLIFQEIEELFSAPTMPIGVLSCLASPEYYALKRKYLKGDNQ